MTFNVGKQERDFKKLFGVFAGTMTILGTLGFTALIIQSMNAELTENYFQMVWVTVGCMVLGLIMVRIYQVIKGDRS